MKKLCTDSTLVGLALFSMFFGAGNIIFPPGIGLKAGADWPLGFIFYYMADIGLSIVTIFAMLRGHNIDRVEGIMSRLGEMPAKLMMSAAVLCIGPLLAIPRTGATTYEMAVVPLFGNSGMVLFTIIYFAIVLVLTIRESAVVDIVGRYLTPLLVLGLLTLIVADIINPIGPISLEPMIDNVVWYSISSGYQTLDVLAAMVFGLIIVNALKSKGHTSEKNKFISVIMASLVAGLLLFLVYGGLCYLGATVSTMYPADINLAQLVIEITKHLFGKTGVAILSVTVSLACVTTAVAVTGAAGTFFSTLTQGRLSYKAIVTAVCVFSAVVANFGLDAIIAFAVPILMIIYPGTLVVVILSLFNDVIKNDNIFKFATAGALLVSLGEVLTAFFPALSVVKTLPLSTYGFGWLVPAVAFGGVGFFVRPAPRARK